MKLTDRLFELIKDQLDDPDKVESIRNRIIAPSLNLFHDELKKSGYDQTLSTIINSVMWPVILMISITLFLCIATLNIQVYMLLKTRSM